MQSLKRRRHNLGEEIADVVRRLILTGDLAPGERVNEVHLAQELGFSRTPVREALNLLTGEGFLTNEPRRGFFVVELTVEEVRDLYGIRWVLDPEALRLSGIPSASELAELRTLNEEISAFADAGSAHVIELDERWHLRLITRCPNGLLIRIIEQQMVKTRRYEHAYFGDGHNLDSAIREHREILQRLDEGDLDGACASLRRNMESATGPLIAWLRQRSDDRQP